MISKIKKGQGIEDDLDKLLLIAETMQQTAFCALGQSPIMPIRSALENFRDEFLALTKK